MWKRLLKDENGFAMMDGLVALLIIGGAAITIVSVLTPIIRDIHNAALSKIGNITGGGF